MDLEACEKKLNNLCYICGLFTPITKTDRCSISTKVKAAYLEKYSIDLIGYDFAPRIVCRPCYRDLDKGHGPNIPTRPMQWSNPKLDHSDCYGCLCPSFVRCSLKGRKDIQYPQFPATSSKSASWETVRDRSPIAGPSRELPQPETSAATQQAAPLLATLSTGTLTQSSSQSSGELYKIYSKVLKPLLLNQARFNDLCRDINLTGREAEILGSRLLEWHLCDLTTKITAYREDKRFSSKFAETEIVLQCKKKKHEDHDEECEEDEDLGEEERTYNLGYIKDLKGLFELFQIEHVPSEWRLFIDGSSNSLKAVLLHNENRLPSIPLAYCKKLPEKYESMRQIFDLIKYNDNNWDLVVDFKLINIVFGLMSAAAKYPCAHCLWDSKYKGADKYKIKTWEPRPQWSQQTKGKHNAILEPLVPAKNILMPPLHIKIGLTTQLFKKLYVINPALKKQLDIILPGLSAAKKKAGVYNGPQIRQLFADKSIPKILQAKNGESTDQSIAFERLQKVCSGFLGNKREENFQQLVDDLMVSYEKLEINITIKMHSLICHPDKFKENCGAYSDEQGERFHQDIKRNEENYAGKSVASALGRYCWTLVREEDPAAHKRQVDNSKKTKYFLVKYDYTKK